MSDIPTQVARNRRDVTRLDGAFVSIPDRVQQNLRFLRNTIEVQVTLEVYTRSLNDGLYSGHPDGGQHGSGHGVSGDVRGGWTLVSTSTASSQFTRGGRNSVRDALDGQTAGSLDATSVGTGSATAQPSDTSLESPTGTTFAYGLKDAADEVRARSHYLFGETGAVGLDPQEFAVEAEDGSLMARATTSSTVPVGRSEEARVDITLTVSGSGSGSSVLTDDGRAAVADSIQSKSTVVGLADMAWGTGTPTIDPSTTSLANEVLRKAVSRSLDLEIIRVSREQEQFEPSSQPHDYTEVGVFDNQGRLVWLVEFADDPYPKDDQTQFTTTVGFRIV